MAITHRSILRFLIIAFLAAATVFTSCKTKKMLTDVSGLRNKSLSGKLAERYAEVLGVPKQQLQNEALYRFVDNWMGVPHRDGGTDKHGIDCSAFTNLLEKEIYKRSLPRMAIQMADVVKRKYESELKEGDLVFFDFNGQAFSHVGIYLQNNRFVHASTSKGVIISNLKDPWYYKYFSRAGSL